MRLRFKKNSIFNVIVILFFSSIINIIISQNVLGIVTNNDTKNVLIRLEKLPFIEGEDNRLWVYSDNNKEKVQYRILYKNNNNEETNWLVLEDKNVHNEWSNYINSNDPYIVDLSNLQLKVGSYQICVQVKYVSGKNFIDSYNQYSFKVLNNSISAKRENAQLEYIVYVTKSKDTLSKIANENLSMFPIDKAIDIIKYENNIIDINKLSIGQKLKIPYKNKKNYVEYIIKKKESLNDIVKKYIGDDAVDFYVKMILKENYFKSEEDIKANKKIYIPKNFLNQSIN